MKNHLEITEKPIDFLAASNQNYEAIWSNEAIDFITALHENFDEPRKKLLLQRSQRQNVFDQGILPVFLPETKSIRKCNWKASRTPDDLLDRRVEITGPVDRKMIINALNSGAKTFMADF